MAEETKPETNHNQAEDHAPSTSEPVATDLPTANAPDPKAVNPEANPNAAGEKSASKPAARKPKEDGAEAEAKPAKAKKEKAPALEDKPFMEFIQQDYLPALKTSLAKQGIEGLTLTFEKQPIAVIGLGSTECWQIIGRWRSAQQPRQFNLYFLSEDINGQKGFSYSESGGKASTFESFLIDERKVNLDLLIYGAIQRLNAQKWLVRN